MRHLLLEVKVVDLMPEVPHSIQRHLHLQTQLLLSKRCLIRRRLHLLENPVVLVHLVLRRRPPPLQGTKQTGDLARALSALALLIAEVLVKCLCLLGQLSNLLLINHGLHRLLLSLHLIGQSGINYLWLLQVRR